MYKQVFELGVSDTNREHFLKITIICRVGFHGVWTKRFSLKTYCVPSTLTLKQTRSLSCPGPLRPADAE